MIINGEEKTAWGYISSLEWEMFKKYGNYAYKYVRASNLRKMFIQGSWCAGSLFSGDPLTRKNKYAIDKEFEKIEKKLRERLK